MDVDTLRTARVRSKGRIVVGIEGKGSRLSNFLERLMVVVPVTVSGPIQDYGYRLGLTLGRLTIHQEVSGDWGNRRGDNRYWYVAVLEQLDLIVGGILVAEVEALGNGDGFESVGSGVSVRELREKA